MLRSFVASAGLRASCAAHASRIASGTARSPLLSARCSPAVTSLHCCPRRNLWIRSTGLSAVSRSSCSQTTLGGRLNALAAVGRGERDERGFTRASALLTRRRSVTPPPAIRTPPVRPSAARPTAARTPVAAAAAGDAQPSAAAAPASGLRLFFPLPEAPLTPLSWGARFRFLVLESCTVVAALVAGGFAAEAAHIATPLLAPHMDALVMFFGANAVSMPAAVLVYVGLLYVRAKRGSPFTLPPLPRASSGITWRGWLLLAVVVLVISARLKLTGVLVPPVQERDLILEASLDDQWAPVACVGLVGPVTEELLFRGLLFARCARFLGVGPAVLLSSVAFGLLHGSGAGPGALLMGTVFAGLFSTTGTLLAPIAAHIAANSSLFVISRTFSPMVATRHAASAEQRWTRSLDLPASLIHCSVALLCAVSQAPLDSVSESFASKFASLKQMRFLSCLSQTEVATFMAAMQVQSQPQARQETAATARSIFAMLDRGNKGQLDASEIAWLMSLRADETRLLNAVVSVVERRVGGDEDRLSAIQRNMDCIPADVPLLDLPCAWFFSDAHRRAVAEATADSQPADPPQPFLPFVLRANAGPLIPIEPRVQAMQSELLHRYYSIQWNAFYRTHFPLGCDRASFESFFCRAFASPDHQLSMFSALLSSSDDCTHPVAMLLQQHREGRQSFGGVTRRRGVAPVASLV